MDLCTQLVSAIRRQLAGAQTSVPEAGRRLWSIFVELSNARGSNGFGFNPISHAEIEAYCRLHRWPLRPHHVAILRAMDGAWLQHSQGAASKTGQTPPAASQVINPAVFDAVFG